jgi:hypothetical protein
MTEPVRQDIQLIRDRIDRCERDLGYIKKRHAQKKQEFEEVDKELTDKVCVWGVGCGVWVSVCMCIRATACHCACPMHPPTASSVCPRMDALLSTMWGRL